MSILKIENSIKNLSIIGMIIVLGLTTLVYSNHFSNPFFFDDSHTIETNNSITSLNNWLDFFTNADTFSSLPANRAYRPMMTLMNAIDYKIAGGLNSFYFHVNIFIFYLVTVILFFILCNYLFKNAVNSNHDNKTITIVSLIATLYFATHTINAETINYICARSDSFSSLCVLASLLLFVWEKTRKYHLYLITMITGIWSKQTAVMFLPILFFFLLLFFQRTNTKALKENFTKWFLNMLKMCALPALIGLVLFVFNQFYLTPSSTISSNTQVSRLDYILTQFYVVLHYMGNFLLPTSLSADPDIEIINRWYDKRILLGMLMCVFLIYVAIKSAKNPISLPITFGIAWFFTALIPTWLTPLYQISNDHRMFFPFMGLFISVPWAVYLKLYYKKNIKTRFTVALLSILFISSYSFGTYQRNKVWKDSETLWKDVTEKSPKNGRGQMNYGLALMAKGDYKNAEFYFKNSEKKSPNWYAVKINLAILNGAIGKHEIAEKYFKSAISLNVSAPDPEYYYARYLMKRKQYEKASSYTDLALMKSPSHVNSIILKSKLEKLLDSKDDEINKLREALVNNPNSIEILIEISNKLYYLEKYDESVAYCLDVLQIDNNNKFAYNNMCACYNQKKQWVKAEKACKRALEIDPNFEIAKNNLNWALNSINKQ